MNRGFSAEVERVIACTVVCVLLGLMNGYLAVTLIVGGALYMAWMMWQMYRLDAWLKNSRRLQPPDAGGIWGDIFDNITRLQKRQKREKLRLQAVVKRGQETTAALRDGIILLDNKGNIDWFNTAAGQLLKLRQEDQGNPLVNYVRHPRFIKYLEEGDFQEPLDLPSPQSEYVRLQYEITHFGKGESLLLVRDVTRLHNLEQMRKDFVANVSHELRTPLTVIRGYVETLSMSPDLPDSWQRALQQMEQQGLRMTSLINDLLALSKLETADRQLVDKPVDLKPLLERVCNDARAFSADKQHNIVLHCPEGSALLGSELELQSAFSNLVFNAVKYSPAKKDVTINVTQNTLGLQVSVTDQGEGIEEVHLPRLTERFYRVDSSRKSDTGGTGLGLAIVKHVLIRHGGNLEIQSKLGLGSTFTCNFPIQSVAASALSA
ncbi:phosphate regulon sensor histidine kinase PhoR [Aestuariicella hydrocarbonica]|uniref:Phosphate regulon sensor protein PhoR n=1 Tax=Pseudomaricurvus hydrocarbonicus TaxID=1470433 RepID=A0A9E5MPY6_9GAMM|nr:phosphate regulon sensor histidine kinase PhoR [Aestuariicella hydrocarbonica]NHO68197.1 phosphate regulon sensor histidine kinase PhoR [Aestuariicella hydrocarbonica]